MKKKILNPYSYSHNFCFLFDSENIHDESLDQEESLRFICCGRLGVPSKKKKIDVAERWSAKNNQKQSR